MRQTHGFSQRCLGNPHHVLHHLLPPVRHNIHNMRQRSHNRIIPKIKSYTFKKPFIYRMALKLLLMHLSTYIDIIFFSLCCYVHCFAMCHWQFK